VAISFSIESGSLEIRNKLKRPYVTNEQIIEFCGKLHLYGIKTTIAVIYCYPFETLKTYNETIKLLQLCKPERIDTAVMGVISKTETERLKKEMQSGLPNLFDKQLYLTTQWRVYIKYKTFYGQTINIFIRWPVYGIRLTGINWQQQKSIRQRQNRRLMNKIIKPQ
jgi:radical SAM superfamily enzyme YgiQ (UPF0313 family)